LSQVVPKPFSPAPPSPAKSPSRVSCLRSHGCKMPAHI